MTPCGFTALFLSPAAGLLQFDPAHPGVEAGLMQRGHLVLDCREAALLLDADPAHEAGKSIGSVKNLIFSMTA